MPERLRVIILTALIVGTISFAAAIIFEPITKWLHRRKRKSKKPRD